MKSNARSLHKPCAPGSHVWKLDAKENRTRIDGGSYHRCVRCGEMAGSCDARESWSQEISRMEKETDDGFNIFLNRILDVFNQSKRVKRSRRKASQRS